MDSSITLDLRNKKNPALRWPPRALKVVVFLSIDLCKLLVDVLREGMNDNCASKCGDLCRKIDHNRDGIILKLLAVNRG